MSDTAQVAIINTALGLLGQEPVADLSEPSLAASNAATKLMRSIEEARASVLARHGWTCALGYATLAPAVLPAAAYNWRYPTAFLLPGGALRVWEIAGQVFDAELIGGWGPRWQVGTFEAGAGSSWIIRAAAGDCGPGVSLDSLNVAYVRRATWSALDQGVTDAIAYDCAARQAYSITGELALASSLAKRAEGKVTDAIGGEATQEGGQPPLAPSIPAGLRARAR